MIINHNMNALNAHRQMASNTVNSGKSMEKLSSGLRINRAGDDAAGLAISEKMRGQIRGLDQAARNSQDGISMIQTAEGALNETQSILQRMRELATQAANDTNTTEDRGQLQNEINQLTSEINRIGNTTEFNTQTLMNGDFDFKAATAAKVTGKAAVNGINIASTTNATNTTVTGQAPANLLPTTGAATAFKATGAKTVTSADVVGQNNNELTISVGGTDVTVTSAAAATTLGDAIISLNGKLTAAGSDAELSIKDGKLVISSKTPGAASPEVEVKGGNFAEDFMGIDDITTTAGTDNGAFKIGAASTASLTGKDLGAAGAGVVKIDENNNELTIKVDDTNYSISLAQVADINADAASRTAFLTDINAKLTTAGAGVTASFDGDKIKLEATAGAENIDIRGGNAVGTLFGDPNADVTKQAGVEANNVLTIDIDGATETITLADGDYASLDEVVEKNKEAFKNKGLDASVDGGALKLESTTIGSAGTITNIQGTKLAKDLGLVDAAGVDQTTLVAGQDAGAAGDNSLDLKINGKAVNVTFADGDNNDAIKTKIQNAINTADANATVSFNSDSKLEITNNLTGEDAAISVVGTNDAMAASLGLDGLKAEGEEDTAKEVKFQIGANKGQAFTLTISDMRSKALGISGEKGQDAEESGAIFTKADGVTNGTTNVTEEAALDISSHESSTAAIKVINDAINSVSSERSKLGAYQNRLEHTITNLGTSSENLTAAESRIRDVDMAKEMMSFSKNNILSQAAQAMLAQANQQPQGVLQLLR